MGEKQYKKIISGIPNACTLANATCGIIALLIAVFYKTSEAINIACGLIVVGGLFDTIDGRLARKLKLSSEMGKQLDSFADAITFGIAPICIFLAIHSYGNANRISLPEILIASFYISCTIYRLARYNVSDYTEYFLGLPSTSAGMLMSLYTFISKIFMEVWAGEIMYTWVSYGIIILLGIAMVSTVKVKRI